MALIKSCVRFSQLRVFVSCALLICNVLFAQAQKTKKTPKTWEVGAGLGQTFLMQNYRVNDAVDREAIGTLNSFHAKGNSTKLVGRNVQSLGFVINRHTRKNGYWQLGYDQRFRSFNLITNEPQFGQYSTGDLSITYPNDINTIKPGQGDITFLVRSTNIPLSYNHKFTFPKYPTWQVNVGLGLSWYTSLKSQMIRNTPREYDVVASSYPSPSEEYLLHYRVKFETDSFYFSNADILTYYSLGIQKELKNKSKLEFNISFLDNFRGLWYDDFIEVHIDPQVRQKGTYPTRGTMYIPDETLRFNLQQGGLMISLRYYPKPFRINDVSY